MQIYMDIVCEIEFEYHIRGTSNCYHSISCNGNKLAIIMDLNWNNYTPLNML